jgi:membrane-associated protein
MSFADPGLLGDLVRMLTGHRQMAYLLLFAGSLVETVLPFALLVPGELVFLAGSMLAGLHQLDLCAVCLSLIGGGLAGDHASYWMGRRFGPGLLARMRRLPWLGHWVSARRRLRARALMRVRGGFAVFLARFAGPVSWVTPMLAGGSRLRYATFTVFNTPAVILGIGQFIVIGYLSGRQAGALLHVLRVHAWPAAVALASIALVLVLVRIRRRQAGRGVVGRTSPWERTRCRSWMDPRQ